MDDPSTGSRLESLLGVVAKLLFALAGLAFWFGGGLIHALTNTDRITAEMEGVALTVLLVALGVIAKVAEDRLEEGAGGPKSLSEALRK